MNKVGKILFLLIFLLLLSLQIISANQKYPLMVVKGYSDMIEIARWISGDLEFVQGSTGYNAPPLWPTALPHFEVAISNIMKLDVIEVERWIMLFGMVIGTIGVFICGYILSRSTFVGLLSCAILPVSWIRYQTIGYKLGVWEGQPNLGTLAIGLCILVWGIWLAVIPNTVMWFLPYLLGGVLFYIHPTFAVILLTFFVANQMLEAIRKRMSWDTAKKNIQRIVIGVGCFLAISFPQLLDVLSSVRTPRVADIQDIWWRIMIARKQFHLFPWRDNSALVGFIGIVIIYSFLLLVMREKLPQQIWNKLLATLSVVVILVIFNVVVTEIFQIRFLTSIVLTRATVFLPLGVVILIAQLFWDQLWERSREIERSYYTVLRRVVLLLTPIILVFDTKIFNISVNAIRSSWSFRRFLMGIVINIKPYQVVLIIIMLAMLVNELVGWLLKKKMKLKYISICIMLLGLFINEYVARLLSSDGVLEVSNVQKIRMIELLLILSGILLWFISRLKIGTQIADAYALLRSNVKQMGNDPWKVIASVTLILLLGLIVGMQLPGLLNPIDVLETSEYQDWLELTSWMSSDTEQDALFLFPPITPRHGGYSLRSDIMNYAHIGYSVSVPELTEFDLIALRTLYDIDLLNMSLEEIDALSANLMCEMQHGYYELLSDIEDLSRVKTEFPLMSYVVSIQPGYDSFDRGCEPFVGEILDLPIIFQNDRYIIYDVKNLGENS